MKNAPLKRLQGITAQQLLAEARTTRQRVSRYSDKKREQLVGVVRATTHGKTAGRA
jgi:hypothetical protein